MTISMNGGAVAARPKTAVVRLYSTQPSRRAVLHVRAAGDPAVPPDLVTWFTERAFHYYLAGLPLPDRSGPRLRWLPDQEGGRGPAFAELDAARALLSGPDGIAQVVVFAQGRGAVVAARWCSDREARSRRTATQPAAADALILHRPCWPAGPPLRLAISCPILVLDPPLRPKDVVDDSAQSRRGWQSLSRQHRCQPEQLGSHVTLLRLGDPAGGVHDRRVPEGRPVASDALGGLAPREFFDELGRWLGAYMYGRARDRLL